MKSPDAPYRKHAKEHRRGGSDTAGVVIEETNGSPSVKNVTKIKVSVGDLTDNGDGSVTLATGGAAGGAHALTDVNNTVSGRTAGDLLIATAATTYGFAAMSGDATITSTGVVTVAATHSGSAHHTAATAGNGIGVAGQVVALAPLTAQWNQTGAFPIVAAGNYDAQGVGRVVVSTDGLIDVYNAAADANAAFELAGSQLKYGAGGASALDISLTRKSATLIAVTNAAASGPRDFLVRGLAVGPVSSPTAMANASASIELLHTNKALLLNVLNTPTSAIVTPIAGMIAYNSATGIPEFYNGSAWVPLGKATRAIVFNFHGGGSALATQLHPSFMVPFACNIGRWSIQGDQAGTCTIDVQKATDSAAPSYASIVGAGTKPFVAGPAVGAVSTAPSSWTSTAIAARTLIQANLSAVSTFTWLTLTLEVTEG